MDHGLIWPMLVTLTFVAASALGRSLLRSAVCGLRSRPKGQLAFLFKAKRVGWIEPHGLEVN
jgi:hypothetical protein